MLVATKPDDFMVRNDHPVIGMPLESLKRSSDSAHAYEDLVRVDAARR
jgi:hypothetical protein